MIAAINVRVRYRLSPAMLLLLVLAAGSVSPRAFAAGILAPTVGLPTASITRVLIARGKDVEIRDPATLALIETIPASTWGYGNANGVAMFGGSAFIAFRQGNKVVRYDLSTRTQVYAWTIPSPSELKLAGNILYVLGPVNDINSIDPATGILRQPNSNPAWVFRFLFGNTDGQLYSLMIGNSIVIKYNPANAQAAAIYGGYTVGVDRITASPDGARVYVSVCPPEGLSEVRVFNAATAAVLTPYGPGGAMVTSTACPVGIAVSPDNSTLYVADSGTFATGSLTRSGFLILDAMTLVQKSRFDVPPAQRVGDLVVDNASGRVYGTTIGGIYVYSPQTGQISFVSLPDYCDNTGCFTGSLAVGSIPVTRLR